MSDVAGNDDARRRYWTEQMDAAFAFMETIAGYPLEECGEPLVYLPGAAEAAGVEVVFSDTPVGNGRERLPYLREGLIDSLVAIAAQMNQRGWVLKVEDAYRSATIQRELGLVEKVFDVILDRVLWENGGAMPSPDLMFRRLSALVATRPKVAPHMSGSGVDISVLRRDNGREIDRGGPYIELSERSPMASPFVSEEAQRNRNAITELMSRHGFFAYPFEFWHYSASDVFAKYVRGSNGPVRYGPVDMDGDSGVTVPIPSPEAPLMSMAEIEARIAEALARRTDAAIQS